MVLWSSHIRPTILKNCFPQRRLKEEWPLLFQMVTMEPVVLGALNSRTLLLWADVTFHKSYQMPKFGRTSRSLFLCNRDLIHLTSSWRRDTLKVNGSHLVQGLAFLNCVKFSAIVPFSLGPAMFLWLSKTQDVQRWKGNLHSFSAIQYPVNRPMAQDQSQI